MIIGLLALAFAMIVGGLLAAFFGWDIVLVERGWTMVIAGSITAASGALLLGIAAAVSKLAQIEARLSRLQGGSGEGALAGASLADRDLSSPALAGGLLAGQTPAEADAERSDDAQPTLPLFDREDRREKDEPAVTTAEWPEDKGAEASVVPFPPRTTPVAAPSQDEDESELKVPDFLLAERRDVEVEPRDADLGVNIYDREPENREFEPHDQDERDDRPEPIAEALSEREPEPEPEIEPAASRDAEPEEEAAPDEGHPATVVGTYNSGDNRYVMFSDGSIEAQTPSGVFRFKSLDELKEFIAAGGEGNSSASI
jgi:hypothetical protein